MGDHSGGAHSNRIHPTDDLVDDISTTKSDVTTGSMQPSCCSHTDSEKCSKCVDISSPRVDELIDMKDNDRARDVFCQSLVPFFVAGLGSIGAGLLLQTAQHMQLVKDVPQLLSVTPPLQGMKGNLDMTFTSRLSTMAHQGLFDSKKDGRKRRILRNLALIQAQSIVISLFAIIVSFCMDLFKRLPQGCDPSWHAYLFLGTTAMPAMALACALMSGVMVLVVFMTRRRGLNPDNIATPLAASLGDLMTITMMLGVGYSLYQLNPLHWNPLFPVAAMLLTAAVVPLWIWAASSDEGAFRAAKTQWPTLMIAAVLSCGAGFIQERSFQLFPDLTAYQPLITGIAGNRAALQASRISSYMNVNNCSALPLSVRLNPWKYYKSAERECRHARLLLLTAIPYQAIFVFISHVLATWVGHGLLLSWWFFLGYLVVAFAQLTLLLFLCQLVVYWLWRWGVDPDMHAIPILTAVGDLVGTALLTTLFFGLKEFNDQGVVRFTAFSNLATNGTCSVLES